MAPSRAQTLSSLVKYLSYISPDIHLTCLLAANAHRTASSAAQSTSSSVSSTAQSHAIELVFFASEDQDQDDIRSRFTLASAELEPLQVIARTLGFPANDVAEFKRMLLSKGEKVTLPPTTSEADVAQTSAASVEESSNFMTVVVHALYPSPPTSSAAAPPAAPQEQFSIFRVLNFELPPPASSELSGTEATPGTPPWLKKLGEQSSVIEQWRHVLARGIREPWDTVLQAQAQTAGRDMSSLPTNRHPGLAVVSEMAVLRGMERQQLSSSDREQRDKEEFGHLIRHLLHAAAAEVSKE